MIYSGCDGDDDYNNCDGDNDDNSGDGDDDCVNEVVKGCWITILLELKPPISQRNGILNENSQNLKITKVVFGITFTKLHQAPKQHLNHINLNCLKLDLLLALILMQLLKHSFDCSN